MRQEYEPIPTERRDDYETLRQLLSTLVSEKSEPYSLVEWRLHFTVVPFQLREEPITRGDPYQLHRFAGYKISVGDSWRDTALTAGFDRPGSGGADLVVNNDSAHFPARKLEQLVHLTFPSYQTQFNHRQSRR